MFFLRRGILLLLFMSFFVASSVLAQETAPAISPELQSIFKTINKGLGDPEGLLKTETEEKTTQDISSPLLVEEMMSRVVLREPEVFPAEIESTFFTFNELQLIRQARKGSMFNSESKADGVIMPEDENVLSLDFIEQGVRTLSLGGIIYLSNTDWTIWINGKELNPDTVPSAVLDIRVRKEYVELEWFDAFTNQIFPLRIRPNQTFNLDARLFLPG